MTLERVPIHDEAAEEAIAASIMLDAAGVIAEIEDLLEPRDFYDMRFRAIYEAAEKMVEQKLPVDQVTICSQLRKDGKFDEIGGILFVSRTGSAVVSPANARTHAQIVRDAAIVRRVGEYSYHICQSAQAGLQTPSELLEDLEVMLPELEGARTIEVARTYEQLARKALDQIEYLTDHRGQIGVPSGWPALDRLTGGWRGGEYILLGGRPKMGKSATALAWAIGAAQAGKHVLVFSLEMSAESLLMRHLAMESEIPITQLRTGDLDEDELIRLNDGYQQVRSLPIFVDDRPGLSVKDLHARTRQANKEHGVDLIIVDYLQLMSSPGRAERREQQVSEMSRGLKNLAREMGVPLIALCQLSRKVEERRPDCRPIPSDLRESGSLEQDCDVLCFMYRASEYGHTHVEMTFDGVAEKREAHKTAELIVALQRNGPTGSVWLNWLPTLTRLTPLRTLDPRRDAPSDDTGEVEHFNNE